MQKYGIDNFYIELLEEVPENISLDEREIFWITKYNSVSPNVYNCTNGGSKFKDDNPMYHKEVQEKVSQYFIGDKNPAKRPEVKEKIRQKALGRKASIESREKMSKNSSKYWLGKKLNPEAVEKRRQKVIESECYKRANNPFSKKVAMLNKDTNEVVKTFDCIADATDWIKENIDEYKNRKVSPSNISSVCHGHQKTAFGFKWKII